MAGGRLFINFLINIHSIRMTRAGAEGRRSITKRLDVSRATMGRIPLYLKYLKSAAHDAENISATQLARALGLGEVQVRKDLGAVSGEGRPKTGYNVGDLIAALEDYLSGACTNVVIAGAGKLGRALLDYRGFAEYGLNVAAAFDVAVKEPALSATGKPVYPLEMMQAYCRQHETRIGIITVPEKSAQAACDRLVECGVSAIWCFAPCTLSAPENVLIQYENMALSLAFLSKKIS